MFDNLNPLKKEYPVNSVFKISYGSEHRFAITQYRVPDAPGINAI